MGVRKDYKQSNHTLAATTSAVAWTIKAGDHFDVKRIGMKISSAPTSAGSITVTLDSNAGAAYDHVLRTVDPVAASATSVVFEEILGLTNGDALLIEYANPDSRTITGTAITEV